MPVGVQVEFEWRGGGVRCHDNKSVRGGRRHHVDREADVRTLGVQSAVANGLFDHDFEAAAPVSALRMPAHTRIDIVLGRECVAERAQHLPKGLRQ
jgi:hypothetical protein